MEFRLWFLFSFLPSSRVSGWLIMLSGPHMSIRVLKKKRKKNITTSKIQHPLKLLPFGPDPPAYNTVKQYPTIE